MNKNGILESVEIQHYRESDGAAFVTSSGACVAGYRFKLSKRRVYSFIVKEDPLTGTFSMSPLFKGIVRTAIVDAIEEDLFGLEISPGGTPSLRWAKAELAAFEEVLENLLEEKPNGKIVFYGGDPIPVKEVRRHYADLRRPRGATLREAKCLACVAGRNRKLIHAATGKGFSLPPLAQEILRRFTA